MTFEYPRTLFALILPLLLLAVQLLRKGNRSVESFGKIQTRGELPRTRRKIFFSCGFFLLIVALARPQWGVREEQVFDQSREVLIAVDLSRSMLASDLSPTRLDRAKIMIEGLLGPLKGERVGLLFFAGTAYLQSPLSPDYEIIREMIPTLSPDWMPQGGTDYTQMLKVASEAFESGPASDRFLIILSDGESTTKGWEVETERLQKMGVKTLCLGLGTETGTVVPGRDGGYTKDERGAVVISKLEPRTLQAIAQKTSGVYRDSTQWVDLHALIQQTVDQGKQGKFEEKRHEKKIERFQWFLGFSFLFLLLSFIYEMPVRLSPRAMKINPLLILFLGLALNGACGQALDPKALNKEIAQLSEKSQVKPQEWAGLAGRTIETGQTVNVPLGIIETALAGVKKGEKEKPMAADWAKLRKELEELQKRNKEQKKNNPQKNQEKKDQKNKEDKNDPSQKNDSQSKENQSSGEQKNPSDSSENQKNPNNSSDPQKGDQKNSPDQKNPANDQKQKNDPSQAQSGDQQKKEGSESGQEGKQDSGKEEGKSQKVGGQQRELEQMKVGKISKEELMQLNQVKQGDSPGKLFQVLEGKPNGPAKDNQVKDW